MKVRQVAVMALGVAAHFAACTRVELAEAPPPVAYDGGFAGESQGGAGSLPGTGGAGVGGMGFDDGGAPASVELGIWPTFASDAEDPQVGAVLAAVAALSAGSPTLPVYERWDDLSGATGSPRAVAWSRLDAMIAPYRERSAGVALCVGIVDREAPAWPVAELGADAALSAIERTIDEVYARYASQLSHLCFGHELDRYLAVADAGEAEQVMGLVGHAVDYARRHPFKAARTSVSTSITLAALESGRRTLLDQVLLGDEAVVVYDPLDTEGALKAPESIASEVDAGLEVLARLPKAPKLALFEVGYPSVGAEGATARAQRSFYESLFDTLDSRRGQVSFVGVYGLGDRSIADCEAEAAAFDASAEPSGTSLRALVRCNMGLRADAPGDDDPPTEKPAWQVVSSALSSYR